jgi:RNA polymerase sigma-70 factor (ECF subfamily)
VPQARAIVGQPRSLTGISPPLARTDVAQALSVVFGRGRSHWLVATRANGQPAFGVYLSDPHAPVFHANGLMVVTLAGSRASALTRFDNSTLSRFGLPRMLPA